MEGVVDYWIIGLFALVSAGFAGIFLFLYFRLGRSSSTPEDPKLVGLINEWVKQTTGQIGQLRQEVQGRLDKNTDTLQSQLDKTNQSINKRLDNAAQVIGTISKELGQMSDLGRQMRDLQDFLRSPKLRGNLGEQVLVDLIKQSIPHGSYALQYTFKDGQRVDVVIKTAEGLVPIDAKFPLDSFKRLMSAEDDSAKEQAKKDFAHDVKKHIDDIAKKYILPAEGTLDFALMYVPSEPVAYEVFVNHPEIMAHARTKRITLASPNQFQAFLQVVLLGMERQQVSQKAKLVLEGLRAIQKDADRFNEEFRVLLRHISNAKNMADSADHSLSKLTNRIELSQRVQVLPEGKDGDNQENLK